MKKLTLIILLLAIVFNSKAQKIDWVNAPMNPIAFKYKKEHFNLKGDVYAYGQQVFSKGGVLIYEYGISKGLHYFYKNGLPYADTEGKLYEFNSQGYIAKYTYASLGVQSQRYIYNAKGLLTNQSNTKGYNVTYDYDDNGRLIKSNIGGGIKEFSYQKSGEQLIVTEKDLSNNPAVITKHIYKNGIEIGRNDKFFDLKYDKLGNLSDYQSAIYYSDVNKSNNEFTVVYTKPSYGSADPLYDCEFYINGQKADFLFKETLQRKDILLYNPFAEKYFIIENAIDPAKSGIKQIFAKVLVDAPYFVKKTPGFYGFYYKGATLSASAYLRKGALTIANLPFYFVYDKGLNMTFYGAADNGNPSGFYPVQQISPIDNLVYLKRDDKHIIIVEGLNLATLHPDYKVSVEKNGNIVVVNDSKAPVYIFPNAASAVADKPYPGRKYSPSKDKLALENNTPPAQTNGATSAAASYENDIVSAANTYLVELKKGMFIGDEYLLKIYKSQKALNRNDDQVADFFAELYQELKQKDRQKSLVLLGRITVLPEVASQKAKEKILSIDRAPSTPINDATTSVKPVRESTQSRLYNGKYTKETALTAVNKYIANLKKLGTYSFVGGETLNRQIDGIWTQKITEQDKITVNIRYLFGDNNLTIELISAILDRSGKTVLLYAQSPNESVRKLYDNQVGMFVEGLFSYLNIKNNIASTPANIMMESGNSAGQTSKTRYFNGKYSKEIALQKVNEYINIITDGGVAVFKGGNKLNYQQNGFWTVKLGEQGHIVMPMKIMVEDNALTIKIISAVINYKNAQSKALSANDNDNSVRQLYNSLVWEYIDGFFLEMDIDKNTSPTPTNTKAIYFRPFTPVDISNKVLSAEAKAFFGSYNSKPDNISNYVTDIGNALKQKNYIGQVAYSKFTDILKEIYNVDKYAAFRIMIVVDKTTFDATLKLIPNDMRTYLREEAKFKIEKEKGMNANQR